MSRIGKQPVEVPAGVEVKIDGSRIAVKGKKGELNRTLPRGVSVTMAGSTVSCTVSSSDKRTKALWGLTRVLVFNMVAGVSNGFKKELEIIGVGYRAEIKGKMLFVNVGFSHPFIIRPPQGITFGVEGNTKIIVEGIDKELVGQVAADIRAIRPPEPYKGKGIKYSDEHIMRKAGKTAGK